MSMNGAVIGMGIIHRLLRPTRKDRCQVRTEYSAEVVGVMAQSTAVLLSEVTANPVTTATTVACVLLFKMSLTKTTLLFNH